MSSCFIVTYNWSKRSPAVVINCWLYHTERKGTEAGIVAVKTDRTDERVDAHREYYHPSRLTVVEELYSFHMHNSIRCVAVCVAAYLCVIPAFTYTCMLHLYVTPGASFTKPCALLKLAFLTSAYKKCIRRKGFVKPAPGVLHLYIYVLTPAWYTCAYHTSMFNMRVTPAHHTCTSHLCSTTCHLHLCVTAAW